MGCRASTVVPTQRSNGNNNDLNSNNNNSLSTDAIPTISATVKSPTLNGPFVGPIVKKVDPDKQVLQIKTDNVADFYIRVPNLNVRVSDDNNNGSAETENKNANCKSQIDSQNETEKQIQTEKGNEIKECNSNSNATSQRPSSSVMTIDDVFGDQSSGIDAIERELARFSSRSSLGYKHFPKPPSSGKTVISIYEETETITTTTITTTTSTNVNKNSDSSKKTKTTTTSSSASSPKSSPAVANGYRSRTNSICRTFDTRRHSDEDTFQEAVLKKASVEENQSVIDGMMEDLRMIDDSGDDLDLREGPGHDLVRSGAVFSAKDSDSNKDTNNNSGVLRNSEIKETKSEFKNKNSEKHKNSNFKETKSEIKEIKSEIKETKSELKNANFEAKDSDQDTRNSVTKNVPAFLDTSEARVIVVRSADRAVRKSDVCIQTDSDPLTEPAAQFAPRPPPCHKREMIPTSSFFRDIDKRVLEVCNIQFL